MKKIVNWKQIIELSATHFTGLITVKLPIAVMPDFKSSTNEKLFIKKLQSA